MKPPALAHLADELDALAAAAPAAEAGDPELGDDLVVIAKALLRELVSMFKRNKDPRNGRAAALAGKILDALAQLQRFEAARPKVIPPDEVARKIEARADDCVALSLRYTREAAAKLTADRIAFARWLLEEGGAEHAAEVVRRVDAMLGGPAT